MCQGYVCLWARKSFARLFRVNVDGRSSNVICLRILILDTLRSSLCTWYQLHNNQSWLVWIITSRNIFFTLYFNRTHVIYEPELISILVYSKIRILQFFCFIFFIQNWMLHLFIWIRKNREIEEKIRIQLTSAKVISIRFRSHSRAFPTFLIGQPRLSCRKRSCESMKQCREPEEIESRRGFVHDYNIIGKAFLVAPGLTRGSTECKIYRYYMY